MPRRLFENEPGRVKRMRDSKETLEVYPWCFLCTVMSVSFQCRRLLGPGVVFRSHDPSLPFRQIHLRHLDQSRHASNDKKPGKRGVRLTSKGHRIPLREGLPSSKEGKMTLNERKPIAPQEPEKEEDVHPVLQDYQKGTKVSQPELVQGDLAPSSIFESKEFLEAETEEPAEALEKRSDRRFEPVLKPLPTVPQVLRADVPTRRLALRNPENMATVLDPTPDLRRRWERKMVIRQIRKRGRLNKVETIKRTERSLLAKSQMFKTSLKKLGPLARQIAGKTVEEAKIQMRFSKKKAAKEVLDHLEYAESKAVVERRMGLGLEEIEVEIKTKDGKRLVVTDPTKMYIDQAWVGRGQYGSGLDHRARGQINRLRPPKTSISLLLKEEVTRMREHEEREEKHRNRKLWVQLQNRPITAQRQYYSW